MRELLNNRTKSSFNISVGTGLALEALFIPTSERIDEDLHIDTYNGKYTILYISLYTLVRNIISSLDTQVKKRVFELTNYKPILNIVNEEIEIINALSLHMNKQLKVFAYKPISLLVKSNNSVKSKPTANMYILSIYKYIKNELKIKELKDVKKDSVMLTSLGVDLLLCKGVWLESHTGKIHNKKDFNKKYHMLKDMDYRILPFNEFLLKIFGDNSGLILTPTPKERKRVYNCLLQNKVNPTKSESWCKTIFKQC